MREKIGIGYENYKQFIDKNLYYVDKTLLVRDVLEKGGAVTLLTRPRRFGKTLGLSMLRTFFEMEYDRDGSVIDKGRYFKGMNIMECGEEILSHMGRYPVIQMSLKSAKRPDFDSAFLMLRSDIVSEFERHHYLQDSPALSDYEKAQFRDLWAGDVTWNERTRSFQNMQERKEAIREESGKYANSLNILSKLLKKHHGTNVIIFLDEYDVPLENAWTSGFYHEMIGFIRSFFESALKTNDALEFAVITGCLRISKESIFTGLNNLKINSVMEDDFSEGFGFTQEETDEMLRHYGLTACLEEVREWYNGYLFGKTNVYNPWSVTGYIDGKVNGKRENPVPYWSNTSSNAIIRELVYHSDENVRKELDLLISGGSIEKRIHEDITYSEIHESEDNLWNFLFFTGYLKKVSERQEGNKIYVTLRIPNREISCIYEDQIRGWFDRIVKNADRQALYKAIAAKDTQAIAAYLTELLEKSISYFDSAESFYQGFLLSLMYDMPRYSPRSNREEGNGRPDIVLYPDRPMDPAYLFECKVRKKFNEMQDGLQEAFDQIRDQHYEDGILCDGYAGVVSFGICFCKKSCIVGLYSG